MTRAEIIALQQALGVPADGIYGPITQAAHRLHLDQADWTPVPAPPVAGVTALQGLLALDAAGLAAAYEAWATAPDRTFAERAFIQRAGHWARDDATLLSAATTLGLTDDELDALFVQAATL